MQAKTLLPNLIAALLVLAGWLLDAPVGDVLLMTGLFALSGALTNWLAIHMLFERVPGLYGSGVITLRFEDIKHGIVNLVREELFGEDKVQRLFETAMEAPQSDTVADASNDEQTATEDAAGIDMSEIVGSIDVDTAFDQLLETVEASSFGNLLQMVGGTSALEPLRDPFGKRLRRILDEAARSPKLRAAITRQLSSEGNRERFRERLERLLQARLDELTPEMVRDLMSRLIRRHLGWLVVWGAVFGGLIGLATGLAGVLA